MDEELVIFDSSLGGVNARSGHWTKRYSGQRPTSVPVVPNL
jgi:hypothetical protein